MLPVVCRIHERQINVVLNKAGVVTLFTCYQVRYIDSFYFIIPRLELVEKYAVEAET